MAPLDDVLAIPALAAPRDRHAVVHFLLHAMHRLQEPFWAWSRDQWLEALRDANTHVLAPSMAVAYLLCGHRDLHRHLPRINRPLFARRILGQREVDESLARIFAVLGSWGYSADALVYVRYALCDMLLSAGTADLERVAAAFEPADCLAQARPRVARAMRIVLRAMTDLGLREADAASACGGVWTKGIDSATADVPPQWAEWCQRWLHTSTLNRRTREGYLHTLLKAGRWIAAHRPEAASPAGWTLSLAAEYVAAVDRMVIGDWSHAPKTRRYLASTGLPLNARTKAGHLAAMRTFFRDAQEWGWIERRFDPGRVLSTPRSVRALLGPEPRVISDDVWAKLLWAGLNLTPEDVPAHGWAARTSWYPFEMVKAVAVVWLFAGLRVNEITRLRVGCVRWQTEPAGRSPDSAATPATRICLLDVPAHKTGTAFTKPVDGLVGEAIDTWERARPDQPQLVDYKTGQAVHLLLAHRVRRLSRGYVNRFLIPLLSTKPNVPESDARGRITSHKARSTIASQLYNAKDPMTLFELQAWLGHRSPATTQYYAQIRPVTLARAYSDAGYFARNVRTIEVLIDREAVTSGAAAHGRPWQFFDLGHGYCSYDFFEQCPHRMACARCDFYVPKASSRGQLMEVDNSLQRMRASIPLTDDEMAAVDGDAAAVKRLLAKLEDVPTPAGPTPAQLGFIPLRVIPSPVSTTARQPPERSAVAEDA